MDMTRIPKPGQIYNHFKNKPYQIITVAIHAETQEKMVVYQALYGDFKTYIRPLDNFLSEVDHEKYPQVTQRYRFELCTDIGVSYGNEIIPVQAGRDTEKAGESGGGREDTYENQADNITEGNVNAVLLKFLDAESYYKKLEVITSNRKHMDDRLINDMAVALDCTVDEGPMVQRIQELVYCLQAMCRFEDKRLR